MTVVDRRCQCDRGGIQCPREMTAEDLLCDCCRGASCGTLLIAGFEMHHIGPLKIGHWEVSADT